MKQLYGTFYYYKGYLVQLLPSGFCRVAEVKKSIGLDKNNGEFLDRLPKIVDSIIAKKEQARANQEQVVNKAVEKLSKPLVTLIETTLKNSKEGQ